MPHTPKLSRSDYDPLFLHARRETAIVVAGWVVFCVWVVGYSGWKGFAPADGQARVETVLGMPAWVFWGIAVPWVAANVFTFWFAFRCMADDPLTVVEAEQISSSNSSKSGSTEVNHG